MATFDTRGFDRLLLDMKELSRVPEGVLQEMLTAEGRVVVRAQKRSLERLGLVDTGQLRDSITLDGRLRGRAGKRYLLITLKGKRQDGSRNAEVGFIHEFGAPKRNITPKQWVRTANEESAGEAVDAAETVFRAWQRSRGL